MSIKLLSPAPGQVLKIFVKQGDRVTEETVVLLLEAMKMENAIYAPSSGVVEEIKVREGEEVETDDVMLLVGC